MRIRIEKIDSIETCDFELEAVGRMIRAAYHPDSKTTQDEYGQMLEVRAELKFRKEQLKWIAAGRPQ